MTIQPDLPASGKTCMPENEDSQHEEDPRVEEEHQRGCRTKRFHKIISAQRRFHKSQGLPLSRSTLHLAFSGADSEEIWEKPNPKLPTLSLLASADCWQILPH